MAHSQPSTVLRHIRKLVEGQAVNQLSDRQLLEQFVSQHDERALEALIQRHGALVLRVCWRVLGHLQDAEDAFQATFLVLARRAAAIRKHDSLSAWLYGVAQRIAVRMKSRERRRRVLIPPLPSAQTNLLDELAAKEFCAVLEEEVGRLPEKYRAPVLLCGMGGQTRDEAITQLGWSLGTFKRRLERGRRLLRTRLARRGLVAPAVPLVDLHAPSMFPSAASPLLVTRTVRAAVPFATGSAVPDGNVSVRAIGLAHHALRAVALSKLQAGAALILLMALVSAGLGPLVGQAPAPNSATPEPPAAKGEPAGRQPGTAGIDRYGDPLPLWARARLGTIRFRTTGLINDCAYSPDGKVLATCDSSHTVCLFEAATGRPIRELRGPISDVISVAFSPDGQILAAGAADDTIRLWEVTTGKLIRQFYTTQQVIWSLAFTPNGKILVSGGQNKQVVFWDPVTGKENRKLEGHQSPVCSISISPDGQTVASSGPDRAIRLWETATGKLIRELIDPVSEAEPVQSMQIHPVAFSPDGKVMATSNRGRKVCLFDVASGNVLRYLLATPKGTPIQWDDSTWTLAFALDGKTLACGGASHSGSIWDLATGKLLWQLPGQNSTTYTSWHYGGVHGITFSPDGKTMAYGVDNRVGQRDVRSGQEIRPGEGPESAVQWVKFGAGNNTLLVASDDKAQPLVEWDLATVKPLRSLQGQLQWTRLAAVTPDLKLLVATDGAGLRLSDTTTGKEVRQFELPIKNWSNTADAIALSPTGKLLASGGGLDDNSIRVWEISTGKEIRKLEHQLKHVWCLAFSPDGKVLASCGDDSIIRLHDLASDQTIRRLESAHFGWGSRLVFSPDGKVVAMAGGDRVVRLWQVASGKVVRELPGQPPGEVPSVAFSPDNRMVAIGGSDGVVHLWEIATGRERRTLAGHRGKVHAVAFASDGKTLASGSSDATALLWNIYGQPRDTPAGPLTPVQLENCWKELASPDPAPAYNATCTLLRAPSQAVPFFQKRLRPAVAPDAQRIAALIVDLNSDSFATRQTAMRELEILGERAEPALRKAAAPEGTAEVRRRASELLDKLEAVASPDSLRMLRALEILEQVHSREAKQVLETLSRGAPAARQTQEAKESLERAAKRTAAVP